MLDTSVKVSYDGCRTQVKELNQVAKLIDPNNDGRISKENWRSVRARLLQTMGIDKLPEGYEFVYDTKGSFQGIGYIDKSENVLTVETIDNDTWQCDIKDVELETDLRGDTGYPLSFYRVYVAY